MESKQPSEEAQTPERIEYLLTSILTRLSDIDQKIDHVIETLHDQLYRSGSEATEAEEVE